MERHAGYPYHHTFCETGASLFANSQLFPNLRAQAPPARSRNCRVGETPTDAYLAADLAVSWVRLTRTAAHQFSLVGHNLTDAVVRHHTSVIKDLAPLPGRGVRFSYSIRLYQPPRPAGR